MLCVDPRLDTPDATCAELLALEVEELTGAGATLVGIVEEDAFDFAWLPLPLTASPLVGSAFVVFATTAALPPEAPSDGGTADAIAEEDGAAASGFELIASLLSLLSSSESDEEEVSVLLISRTSVRLVTGGASFIVHTPKRES